MSIRPIAAADRVEIALVRGDAEEAALFIERAGLLPRRERAVALYGGVFAGAQTTYAVDAADDIQPALHFHHAGTAARGVHRRGGLPDAGVARWTYKKAEGDEQTVRDFHAA